MKIATLAALAALTACSPPPPQEEGNSMTSAGATEPAVDNRVAPPGRNEPAGFAADDYLGRWVGVEGMALDIARAEEPGTLRLAMQWSIDDKGVFTGRLNRDPSAPGIAFTRGGEQLTLRRTDGDATGLKWLAGKQRCLTVQPGEGYCRD